MRHALQRRHLGAHMDLDANFIEVLSRVVFCSSMRAWKMALVVHIDAIEGRLLVIYIFQLDRFSLGAFVRRRAYKKQRQE
mmetsp:Transcript_15989/g.25565  ORF Transcript_15989/g.25565 Transcript_15989/m.25565 type:complete len:80 (+) Transcript_15989:854-1093(+)